MSNDEATREQMAVASVEPSERGIDVFAVAVALLSEWRLGLITFAVVAVFCIGVVFILKPQFVATATVLPQPGRAESGSLASLFSSRGPGTLNVGLLQSRSVQDDVIDRAGLLQLYRVTTKEAAREVLNAKSTFTETPDTLVTLKVRDGNAQNAAKIANAYLDGLQSLNDAMGLQQSIQTARFFEDQLEDERQQLALAETQLANTQKQTGLVAPDAQTQLGLSAIANIRAEITNRQVALAALLQSETEQNPQVQTLHSQISQLQAQERHMEQGSGSPVGAALPAGQMPKNNLDFLRAQRDVKYHDTRVISLANQFAAARLNETFSRSTFQVVDRAVAPERKAWPPRKPFVAGSLVLAALMGLVAVLVKLAWRRIAAEPGHQAQLAQLHRAFGPR